MGHADTYGFADHNFYLYNNPATGKLTWYSWDHNLTFRDDVRPLLTLDKASVSDAWPLIRYLLDDPEIGRYVRLWPRTLPAAPEGGDCQDTRARRAGRRPMRRGT